MLEAFDITLDGGLNVKYMTLLAALTGAVLNAAVYKVLSLIFPTGGVTLLIFELVKNPMDVWNFYNVQPPQVSELVAVKPCYDKRTVVTSCMALLSAIIVAILPGVIVTVTPVYVRDTMRFPTGFYTHERAMGVMQSLLDLPAVANGHDYAGIICDGEQNCRVTHSSVVTNVENLWQQGSSDRDNVTTEVFDFKVPSMELRCYVPDRTAMFNEINAYARHDDYYNVLHGREVETINCVTGENNDMVFSTSGMIDLGKKNKAGLPLHAAEPGRTTMLLGDKADVLLSPSTDLFKGVAEAKTIEEWMSVSGGLREKFDRCDRGKKSPFAPGEDNVFTFISGSRGGIIYWCIEKDMTSRSLVVVRGRDNMFKVAMHTMTLGLRLKYHDSQFDPMSDLLYNVKGHDFLAVTLPAKYDTVAVSSEMCAVMSLARKRFSYEGELCNNFVTLQSPWALISVLSASTLVVVTVSLATRITTIRGALRKGGRQGHAVLHRLRELECRFRNAGCMSTLAELAQDRKFRDVYNEETSMNHYGILAFDEDRPPEHGVEYDSARFAPRVTAKMVSRQLKSDLGVTISASDVMCIGSGKFPQSVSVARYESDNRLVFSEVRVDASVIQAASKVLDDYTYQELSDAYKLRMHMSELESLLKIDLSVDVTIVARKGAAVLGFGQPEGKDSSPQKKLLTAVLETWSKKKEVADVLEVSYEDISDNLTVHAIIVRREPYSRKLMLIKKRLDLAADTCGGGKLGNRLTAMIIAKKIKRLSAYRNLKEDGKCSDRSPQSQPPAMMRYMCTSSGSTECTCGSKPKARWYGNTVSTDYIFRDALAVIIDRSENDGKEKQNPVGGRRISEKAARSDKSHVKLDTSVSLQLGGQSSNSLREDSTYADIIWRGEGRRVWVLEHTVNR